VTFLFYPVADLAQNVHRCVLSYQRDEVVARRRAAGLPVNLDQKEQGGEKNTGQSGAPASISVEPVEAKGSDAEPSNSSGIPKLGNTSKPSEVKPNAAPVSNVIAAPSASETTNVRERIVSAAKKQLARATAEPNTFKNCTSGHR